MGLTYGFSCGFLLILFHNGRKGNNPKCQVGNPVCTFSSTHGMKRKNFALDRIIWRNLIHPFTHAPKTETPQRHFPEPQRQVLLETPPVAPVVQTEEFLLNLANNLEEPLLLVLDRVQDPHNLGACLRTADATGVDAIIIATTVPPFDGNGRHHCPWGCRTCARC